MAAPSLRDLAERWQASRVDVRQSTKVQHRTAFVRVLPLLGARPVDAITVADVQELVDAVAKTRRARWVELPPDLYAAIADRPPAREDRDLDAPLFPIGSTDRLRMAVGHACRDAAVPSWSPHDLRHRRISLPHRQGETWAEIGARSASATSR